MTGADETPSEPTELPPPIGIEAEVLPGDGSSDRMGGFTSRIVVLVALLGLIVGGVFLVRAAAGEDDPQIDARDDADADTQTTASGPGDDAAASAAKSVPDPTSGERVAVDSAFGPTPGYGSQWLVQWGEGFLAFGLVYDPAPLPRLSGDLADLFPPEVREAVDASGATSLTEAIDALTEAGLLDVVSEIVAEHPEVMDEVYAEPPPPTFEVWQSDDGIEWTQRSDISIPGGESIRYVASDGEHLVVASETYDEAGDGPGSITMEIAVSTDLKVWEMYEIPTTGPEDVPDYVSVGSNIGSLTIGFDGWLVSTQSYAWLDEYSFIPADVRDTDAGWNTDADETGLTVEIYRSYEPELGDGGDGDVIEERRDEEYGCCEVVETRLLTWSELGIDYETFMSFTRNEYGSTSIWMAGWGEAPIETAVLDTGVGPGSIVATGAGYVELSWGYESPGVQPSCRACWTR